MTDHYVDKTPKLYLANKILRPLYWVSMLGYILQIVSSVYNIFAICLQYQISFEQKLLVSISGFLVWIDCYTIASIGSQTGILSKT